MISERLQDSLSVPNPQLFVFVTIKGDYLINVYERFCLILRVQSQYVGFYIINANYALMHLLAYLPSTNDLIMLRGGNLR